MARAPAENAYVADRGDARQLINDLRIVSVEDKSRGIDFCGELRDEAIEKRERQHLDTVEIEYRALCIELGFQQFRCYLPLFAGDAWGSKINDLDVSCHIMSRVLETRVGFARRIGHMPLPQTEFPSDLL